MVMKEDIEKLKERFVNAESEAAIEEIDKEMRILADKDMEKFAADMLECIQDTNNELKILSNALVDIGKRITQAAAFVF